MVYLDGNVHGDERRLRAHEPVHEPGLNAGLRLLLARHWQAVVEVDAYPGRLVHVSVLLGYVFDLWRP